jgi:hypothetical protein
MVLHWMALPPAELTVLHASAWRDEGSWNQTVLAEPLCETPIGTQFGAALICDRALLDHNAAAAMTRQAAMVKDDSVSFFMGTLQMWLVFILRRQG